MITCDATGKPALSWHFDQAAIDAEAAADGWYALLANLPPAQASPAEVFLRYKGQHVVERRYGEFKGTLAVTPLFLKTSLWGSGTRPPVLTWASMRPACTR